jgi:hypothetical protein
MPLPVNAIWFPAARTLLIARSGADAPTLFCQSETVDQLGPRASGARRRYWRLPAQDVTKLVAVNESATCELFGASDGVTVPLTLDSGLVAQDALLLVSARRADGAASSVQIEFVASDADFPDASELHRHVRDVLRLGPQDHVEGIWRSPITSDEKGIHVGPARPAWPYGMARLIEVHPPSAARRLSELELTARTDHHIAYAGDQQSIVRLSLSAPRAAILLVWRSIFAGRLNANAPNAFLQTFQDQVAQYLNWSIPFNRIAPASGATERPIARGYFLPKSGTQPELIPPGEPLTLTFRGPLDTDDIAMLCISSKPADQIHVVQHANGAQTPYSSENDDLRRQILCWRATIRDLVPLAWDDIEPKIRAALSERLEAELRRAGAAAASLAASSVTATAEERARSATPRGPLLDPAELFSVDDELRGILDEWFATLDPAIIEKLRAGLPREPIPFTNMARLLPVAIEGMLDIPANWMVFERDAGALQEQAAAVQHLLDPAAALPRGHLRGNPRLWRSILQAMSERQIFDGTQMRLIDTLLPTASGSLQKLDPGDFYKTAAVLSQFARDRAQPSTDGK